MKKLFNIILLLSLSGIVLTTSCKEMDDSRSESEMTPLDRITFYSSSNPGKWKDLPDDHTPVYTVTVEKDQKVITVVVPFNGTTSPIHYIETIILLDHNRKELQKVTFPRGNRTASAVFKLPKDYVSFVYVVAKCNLHDMWEKKVYWE